MARHHLRGRKKPKMAGVRKSIYKEMLKKKGKKKKKGGDREVPQAKTDVPVAAAAATAESRPLTKKEQRQQATFVRMHQALYRGSERVLIVGDGNFSFAHALCKHLGSGAGIYATTIDSEAQLRKKYPDSVELCREVEETYGGTILYGVDATKLHKVKEFRGAFRTIVWNHPHTGSGQKDIEENVREHRQLLVDFFKSALRCLDSEASATIHVSLKAGEPYKSWKVVQTAQVASEELDLRSAIPFMPDAFPGYSYRRTGGFDDRFSKSHNEELAKGAKVFVFRRRPQQAEGSASE